jgi:hypothetical protein
VDWRDLFNMQHLHVHTGKLEPPERMQELVLRGLGEEDLRLVPIEGQNSVAWLLWHIARCEDVASNVVLSDRGQVLDDTWKGKLGVARDDIGIGMTPADVSDFSQRVDLDALLSYRLAVAHQSREVIAQLNDSWLAEPMSAEEVTRLHELGTFAEHAGWVADMWAPTPRIWFLWLHTGHCYMHLGEAITVRSLGGKALGP